MNRESFLANSIDQQSRIGRVIRDSVRNLRIGVDGTYAVKGIDSGQAAALEEALKVLAGLGARIVDVKMPDLRGVVGAWMAICSSEMVAAHAANYPSRASEYGPYLREFLESGSSRHGRATLCRS